MKTIVNKCMQELSITRMAEIQLLSELLNDRINQCVNDITLQLPSYVEPILVAANFPMGSIEFKRMLIAVMPPMETHDGKQRKALRLINQMKDSGTVTSRGRGTNTEYFLTESYGSPSGSP